MSSTWEYARLRAVRGRWVVAARDGCCAPELQPGADLAATVFALERAGWSLDPLWEPGWPYVSLRRPVDAPVG